MDIEDISHNMNDFTKKFKFQSKKFQTGLKTIPSNKPKISLTNFKEAMIAPINNHSGFIKGKHRIYRYWLDDPSTSSFQSKAYTLANHQNSNSKFFLKKIYENLNSNFCDIVYNKKFKLAFITDCGSKSSLVTVNTFGVVQNLLTDFSLNFSGEKYLSNIGSDQLALWNEKELVVVSGIDQKRVKNVLKILKFSKRLSSELIDVKYIGKRKLILLGKKLIKVIWLSNKNSKILKSQIYKAKLKKSENLEKIAICKKRNILILSVKDIMKSEKMLIMRFNNSTLRFQFLDSVKNKRRKFSTLMPFEIMFEVEEGSVILESRLKGSSQLYSSLILNRIDEEEGELGKRKIVPFLEPVDEYLDSRNYKFVKHRDCCWNIDLKGNVNCLRLMSKEGAN